MNENVQTLQACASNGCINIVLGCWAFALCITVSVTAAVAAIVSLQFIFQYLCISIINYHVFSSSLCFQPDHVSYVLMSSHSLLRQGSHTSLQKPPSGALVVSVRSRKSVGELLLKREISETTDMVPTTRVPEFNLYDNLIFHQGTTIDKVPPLDRRRKLPLAVLKPTSHPSYFLLNIFVALVCIMVVNRNVSISFKLI